VCRNRGSIHQGVRKPFPDNRHGNGSQVQSAGIEAIKLTGDNVDGLACFRTFLQFLHGEDDPWLLSMHLFETLALLAASIASAMAQTAPAPPELTLIYSMQALLGDRFSLGPVPNGQERIVIPIVGGSFKGPRLSGTHAYATMPSEMIRARCTFVGAAVPLSP
jgi:hypothetical protein